MLPTNSEKQRIKRRTGLAPLLQRPEPAPPNPLRPVAGPCVSTLFYLLFIRCFSEFVGGLLP